MQNPNPAYQPTTSPAQQSPGNVVCCEGPIICFCTLAHLGPWRLLLKILQLGVSLAALVVQGQLQSYTLSWGQTFFACVSFAAFLFCFLLILLYCTSLYDNVREDQLMKLDVWVAAAAGVLFPVASYALLRMYEVKSDKTTAVVLGVVAGALFFEDAVMVCCKPWYALSGTWD